MENIDQALLESLPINQRQKICKKLRQEQLKRYVEWDSKQPVIAPSNKKEKKTKKKDRKVNFGNDVLMFCAVETFDDREVLQLLDKGTKIGTHNVTGSTILHKCCIEDNISALEILLTRGDVDVNMTDEDMWTPLHVASACDHHEIAQLLLNNGADPALMDVDGNFAIDHTPDQSESRYILQNYLDNKGLDQKKLRDLQLQLPRQMLNDVQSLIGQKQDLNTTSEQGITLLHIASANGYRDVIKVLLENKANVDAQDNTGCTPLHVAAKFNQTRVIKLLLKYKANPRIENNAGDKASNLIKNPAVQQMLWKVERSYTESTQDSTQYGTQDGTQDEEDVYNTTRRVNSRVIRPRHDSLSKKDELYEGKLRLEEADTEDENVEEEDIYSMLSLALSGKAIVDPSSDDKALPESSPTDDLASLSHMTENLLLTELHQRYSQSRIYTYVGDILIAVNPFTMLSIYGKEVSEKYKNNPEQSKVPHIYAIAQNIYTSFLREQHSQCCIISGESGSGKTETSKYLIQHLLATTQSEENQLNVKLQQVNPLLEAFGNAQTVMNENSSRFGKYIELMFSPDGFVQGGKIHEYLLEKSRVANHSEGERNFHIFYLMFAGLSPDEYQKYGLLSSDKHRYVNQEKDLKSMMTEDNRQRFLVIQECLKFLGFSNNDLDNLFLLLSAVLNLGDIHFVSGGRNDSAQISNMDLVRKVASMLQVQVGELAGALVSEVTITRGEQIKKERNVTQARDCCDALAKSLYGRLFSWIVNGINQMIQPYDGCGPGLEVGILDIFGFEDFTTNSFEQLCINLANEQLQCYFNDHIFKLEAQDYTDEGIPSCDITYTNNQPVVDLFLQKHTGIFSLMDEESRFPKATDKSLATKLHKGPGEAAPSIYITPKDQGLTFTICHYAGKIKYNVKGILDKNRDTLPMAIMFTMKTSNSLLIKELFQSKVKRTGSLAPSTRQQRSRKAPEPKSAFDFFRRKRNSQNESKVKRSRRERPVIGTERKGPATIAYHFKNSLAELMSKMNRSVPHFVRCIKPNMAKVAGKYDPEYVLRQLRYTGILETVRIRREGFSMRLPFAEFLTRYNVIAVCALPMTSEASDLQQCTQALQYCDIEKYKVGKSKLFLRYWHVDKLETISRKLESKVITTQRVWKGWMQRKKFMRILDIKRRQDDFVSRFLTAVATMGEKHYDIIIQSREHDTERQQAKDAPPPPEPEVEMRTNLNDYRKNDDIRRSIEALDSIIDEYDEESAATNHDPLYDDPAPYMGKEESVSGAADYYNNPDEITRISQVYVEPMTQKTTTSPIYNNPDEISLGSRSSQVYSDITDPGSIRAKVPPPTASDAAGVISELFARPKSIETIPDLPPPPPPSNLIHAGSLRVSGYLPPPPSGSIENEAGGDGEVSQDATAPPPPSFKPPPPMMHSGPPPPPPVMHAGPPAPPPPPMIPAAPGNTEASKSSARPAVADLNLTDIQVNKDPSTAAAQGPVIPLGPKSAPPFVSNKQEKSKSKPPPVAPKSVRPRTSSASNDSKPVFVTAPLKKLSATVDEATLPAPDYDQNDDTPESGYHTPEGGSDQSEPPPVLPERPVTFVSTVDRSLQQIQRQNQNGHNDSHNASQRSRVMSNDPYSTTLDHPMSPNRQESVYETFLEVNGQKNQQFPPPPPMAPNQMSPQSQLSQKLPPPPPPLTSMPSGVRPPPGTMPKPARNSQAVPSDVPPPPPSIATMPRGPRPTAVPPPPAPGFNTVPRPPGVPAPPPPPPPGSAPPPPGSLLAGISNMKLKKTDPQTQKPSDRPGKAPDSNPHGALIAQIQGGIKLRKSPGHKSADGSETSSVTSEESPLSSAGGANNLTSISEDQPPPPPPIDRIPKQTQGDLMEDYLETQQTQASTMENNAHNASMNGDLDVTQVPGYQPIPDGAPVWRKALLERKNKEAIEAFRKEIEEEQSEKAKWKNIPAWKKNLIETKEKKKVEGSEMDADERRRMEEENRRLQSMPTWKRNLVLKKRDG
ncbi:unnamed protein product [Owenia fusiformis]|uniref:Unconventional myosin-XVI n=1 Tax=Owenia fusiformis TaxID=6347 RepID=A0A8S4NKG1_OWEFU|nr:unnamed protein product [Owenia fusiformis]